jgi:hypothetical protein
VLVRVRPARRQQVQARQALPVRQALLRVVLLWRALALVRLQQPLPLWQALWRLVLLRQAVATARLRHTQPPFTTSLFV